MQDLIQNSSDTPQSRFDFGNLIAAIALRIRESLDLPTILQTTADEVHQLLGSDRVLLYQFEPDWSGQVVVESVSEPRWSLLDRVVRDTCFEACWLEPYHEGKYAVIADVATANLSSCYADFLNNLEIKANLVIPLLCESQLWGLLIVHHCTVPRQWQSAEIEGLQQIAVHVGIAVHQALLLEQLQVAKTNLEAQVAERTVELEQANQQLLGRLDESNLRVNELDQHKSQLAQLAVIVESSQDAIMSKTLDGIITSWNQAAERLFGYAAEEIIGKHVTELIPQERQFEEDAIYRKIYQGERVDTYETQRKHKDGALLDVALTISPIKDANGTVLGASKIARDISGRKRLEFERIQAENELRQSKEQLEDFFDNVSDLIQSVSLKDGRFLFVNRAWREVLGYRSEEIADLNIFDLLAPECIPACQVLFQQLQAGEMLNVDRAEFIFLAKDGRKVFLEGNINVRKENGIAIATRTIFRDVTAQRQTEYILNEQTATLQSFYNSAPLMMGVVELSENDILHISENLATTKFFNSSLDEIIGKWSSELGFPSEHIELWCNHYRHSQEQQQPVSFEYNHVTEAGIYCLLVTVSFIDISNSHRPRFCYVAQDISDRKQSELALKQSEATNEALIKAIPDFLVRMRRDGMQTEVLNHGAIHCLYPENGISGNYISDIMPLEIAQERMRLAEVAIATGQVQKQEYQFIDQGKTYYEKARIAPLWNDEVLLVVGDITDRKLAEETLRQSEARFQHLIAHVPSMIYTIVYPQNAPTYFEYISSAVIDISEITPEQVYADISLLFRQWHPEDVAGWDAISRQSIANLEPFSFEWRIITPSGTVKWLNIYASVELRQNGDVARYGVVSDISDRKQAELDLQLANQQLSDRISELNQRHGEMVKLSEISDFLQACFTVEEACNALSQLVETLFPHCAGGVFVTNTSRNRVEVMSSWGESLQSEDAFLPKDCWALRRGRRHFHADNGVSCNHIPPNEAIAATLCIPMIAQGETIGLFYLSTNTAIALPESKQQLARTLAEQVGLAIANLRLQETLQQQSIRDPLTGLFNRRYLEESLNQELSRAQRQQQQIGVIMIDIDHFKKFNDTYGHDAGDYVLQTVGTLLKKYVRGSDIACRYGGEEMILVLPDSTLESTGIRAEAIREAIAQITLSHNSQLLGSLTASFGVASFPQHGVTGNAVIQSADAALYRAKAAGRNQVLIAPSL